MNLLQGWNGDTDVENRLADTAEEGDVFTSDNFIKMILIIFRIQANIPVIMMGETGCGKTSLIRIISQLLKSEMKTLNIHAGISDKVIINFMEGKVKGKNEINLVEDENEENDYKILLKESKIALEEIDDITKLPNETEEEFKKRNGRKSKK